VADLIRKVRLVLDKASADKAEQDTKAALGGVEGALDSLKRMAAAAGAAIIAAFSIRAIIDFGRSCVTAATDAEKAWAGLGGAIRAAGGDFDGMQAKLRAAGEAFQEATIHDNEDYARSLQRLVTLTGDVGASVNNMGLVANVAAALFGGDLGPATDLVAKAMNGILTPLQRLGIHATSAQDALNKLAQLGMGRAAQEAQTMGGRLAQLNNLWGDFKKEVGFAVIESDGFRGALHLLSLEVRGLLGLMDLLAGSVAKIRGQSAEATIRTLTPAIRGGGLSATEQADSVKRLQEALQAFGQGEFAKKTTADLLLLARALNALREGGGESPWGISITEAQSQINRILQSRGAQPAAAAPATPALPGGTTPQVGARGRAIAAQAAKDAANDLKKELADRQDQAVQALEHEKELMERRKEEFARQSDEVVRIAQREVQEKRRLQEELANDENRMREEKARDVEAKNRAELDVQKKVAGEMAEAAGAALTGNLGPYATMKGQQNLLEAAELGIEAALLAAGIFTVGNAAVAAAGAAEHAAIAAGWFALAGLAGGGGSQSSMGGGSSSPYSSSGASQGAAAATAPTQEVNIYLEGPGFDATNPVVQRVVWGAQQAALERYGSRGTVRLRRTGS
jgi:hypothetical protein